MTIPVISTKAPIHLSPLCHFDRSERSERSGEIWPQSETPATLLTVPFTLMGSFRAQRSGVEVEDPPRRESVQKTVIPAEAGIHTIVADWVAPSNLFGGGLAGKACLFCKFLVGRVCTAHH